MTRWRAFIGPSGPWPIAIRRVDQMAEQVDLVVVMCALQDGAMRSSPMPVSIEGRGRSMRSSRRLLILHEDEVPDLDEAVAILVGRAGRAAPDVVAMVVEDLRAGAAGTGVAHAQKLSEVAMRMMRESGEPGDLLPEAGRLVVRVIDGDSSLSLGRPNSLVIRSRQADRLLLEIVAEGEIAEHLEEGVMAGGVADIVEVVVLAAGAHAFLRGRGARIGPLLLAGEDVLELHHAGIGEHQRRVVARHERARRDDLVAVLDLK
jgi:hypothetical protein